MDHSQGHSLLPMSAVLMAAPPQSFLDISHILNNRAFDIAAVRVCGLRWLVAFLLSSVEMGRAPGDYPDPAG